MEKMKNDGGTPFLIIIEVIKTNVKKTFVIIFVITIIVSCSRTIDYSLQIENDLGIKTENFTIIEDITSSAIGDFYETFDLKIDSTEFQEVLKQINTLRLVDKKWKEAPFGYSYELHYPERDEIKLYQINKSRNTINY